MARDFNAVQKGDSLAAQPIDTTVSAATQMPGMYVYGPPGARRARTYSQVIAEATNGGIDSSANLHNGGKPGPNGPKVSDRQKPDWRGHYLGKVVTPGSLYVHRPLTNAADLHNWAKGAGIPNLVPPEEMHATVVYSKGAAPKLATLGNSITAAGGPRAISPLGDKGAVVLHFASKDLQARHAEAMKAGATHEFPKFLTHVTLSYDAGGIDLAGIPPPDFPLVFGPEVHAPINEDWAEEKGLRVVKAESISEELGLVFGWAIVSKIDGKPYYDLNIDWDGEHAGKRVPEHITEDAMLKGALEFALTPDRPGNEMHAGPETGNYPFVFPLTGEIAKAMGISCAKTGLMIAYKPEPAVLAKFQSGEYTGFSIEGLRGHCVEHD